MPRKNDFIFCMCDLLCYSHDNNNRPKIMGFDAYKKLVTPGFYGAKKPEVHTLER